MFLLVIIRPNSAFATIRDNADGYFRWSLGGFVLMTAQSVVSDIVLFDGMFPIAELLFFLMFLPVFWYISRWQHGNRDWRTIFSVMFYLLTFLSTMLFLSSAFLFIFYDNFDEFSIRDAALIFNLHGFFHFGMYVWFLILAIKAIKVVNDWDTGKAIITGIVSILITAGVMFLFYLL